MYIPAHSAGAVEYNDCISANEWPVGWSYRIHRLHLYKKVRPPNVCPGYDIKQSDGEAPVLDFLGMRSTLSLHLLSSPLRIEVVTPNRFISMDNIELFDI